MDKLHGSKFQVGNHRTLTAMIEVLKSDEIVRRAGGRFKLTALIQHRWRELMEGARPLIERNGRSDLELAIAEIVENKIQIDYRNSDITSPERSLR